MWQGERLIALKGKASRGAILQSDFDKLSYIKPTGLFTTIPSLIKDNRFHEGWPRFGDHNRYTGPLPQRSAGDNRPGLLGKNPDGCFRTGPAAAYGPGLCMSLAGHIFHSWYSMLTSSGVLETPAAGEGRLSATVLVPVPLIGPPPSLKRALLLAKPRLTSAGSGAGVAYHRVGSPAEWDVLGQGCLCGRGVAVRCS